MSLNTLSRDDVLRELLLVKEELESRYNVTRIGVFGSVARTIKRTEKRRKP